MRILFLSHYFPPEGNAPASRTYENCKRWVAAGHEVQVVTCAPNMPGGVVYEGYRNRPFQAERVDGIDVVRLWTYIAANKGVSRRTLNYLSYMFSATAGVPFLRRPDLVVATSPQFFCGWAGVCASRLRGVPLLLEIRDLWPESIAAVGALRQRRLLRWLERLERGMYDAAERIVTVGDGYRERMVARGVPPEKISVVMNGVDRDLFSPREPDGELEKRLGLEGKFVCSYVGTLGMACGLEVVLEAASLLRDRGREDVVFLMVGDGATREELEAEAARRGLDAIRFTGRQPKESIPAFLSISDACLVHLRRTDLFTSVMPSKIFEAGGMARPIILGVEGHAARLVQRAGAGLCMEPENAAELVECVLELADDRNLARTLGEAGHRYVVRHHDRDRLAGDYLRLMQEVRADSAR
jgi:glycosyltransferase involved in cell wall biosynthesis